MMVGGARRCTVSAGSVIDKKENDNGPTIMKMIQILNNDTYIRLLLLYGNMQMQQHI